MPCRHRPLLVQLRLARRGPGLAGAKFRLARRDAKLARRQPRSFRASHPCAGAMLVFTGSLQFQRMIPEGNPDSQGLFCALSPRRLWDRGLLGGNSPMGGTQIATLRSRCGAFRATSSCIRVRFLEKCAQVRRTYHIRRSAGVGRDRDMRTRMHVIRLRASMPTYIALHLIRVPHVYVGLT